MSVIDFTDFQKKKKAQKEIKSPVLPEVETAPSPITKNLNSKDFFDRDARSFKFLNMRAPGCFVKVNTESLPPPFPPYVPSNPNPPMVA